MAVVIRYRKLYICQTYSERSLDWPIDSLIYTQFVDDGLTVESGEWWKIDDGVFTQVPEDELIFTSPIPISKLLLSGIPDDFTYIKSDGSHAQPVGTGPIITDGVTITGQGILGDPLTVPPPASSGTYFVGAPSVIFVGGLDVQIIWPTFFIDGVEFDEWDVTVPPDDTVTLDAADATYDRFDAIYMDSATGLPAVITGTPAENPEQPPLDPTTQLLVTYILVEANQTDLTTDDVIVYDEGAETTVTSNNGTLEIDSTDEVVSDTFSIELGSFNNTHYIDFEFSSLKNRVDFSQMLYYNWLKSTFSNSTYFRWTFYNGLIPVSNTVNVTNGTYNFNRTTVGSFQTIVVPLSAFTWFEGQFDRIRLTFNGSNSDGFWFDFFVLQVGASGVSPVLNFFKTIFDNDGNAVNADQSNDNVTFKGITKTGVKEFTAGFIIQNVSSDVNPAVRQTAYNVDTSGGDVNIILEDSASDNNNDVIIIVKVTPDSNKVYVTTVSGTQDVGNETSLVINERNTGVTVQSNFGITAWNIRQDSRSKPIPLAITLYGLTESSGIGGYNSLATSITDANYSTTPTDQLLPDVTGDDILLGGWITELEGLVSEGNVFFIFKIRKASGLADARFYAEIYHRTSGGTETLLGRSGRTPVIDHAGYVQYQLSAVVTDKVFEPDYFVVKFYGNKEGAATDPAYEVELEGTTPARVVLPVVTTPVTGGGGTWGSITGTLSNQTDLQTALDARTYWRTVPGTPTRVGNTSFTITDTGNANLYDKLLGRRTVLKWTDSGSTKMAMVHSATYATDTVTVTIIGDTLAASATMSTFKYAIQKADYVTFAIAGTMSTGTNLARKWRANCATKVFGADALHGTAGTTNATTYDLNKNGTTMFTTKVSIASGATVGSGFTADNGTTLATDDVVDLDCDSVSTTPPIDVYVDLFILPLNNQYYT